MSTARAHARDVGFLAAGTYRFDFLLTLPQSDTERILAETLRACGIEVERRTVLTGPTQEGAEATVTPQGSGETEQAVRSRLRRPRRAHHRARGHRA